ncbi:MAG: response regulator transcription factor [Chitinophagaceae bacterium]|nr:MAG: response regulator transcription factor [Chitinophagaceae bacterium]
MKTVNAFLIADDHAVVRTGITITIREAFPAAEVTSVDSFAKALEQVSQNQFQVLLLDISLPGGNNLSMVNEIRKVNKAIKILMFSSFDEITFALRYLQSGADGFLSKSANNDEINTAIQTVLAGKQYVSERVKEHLFSAMIQNKGPQNPVDLLSTRETDVLQYILSGKAISEIAELMNLSPTTVSTYKNRIFDKLQVKNLVELINKCGHMNAVS